VAQCSPEDIVRYWKSQALQFGQLPAASWTDRYAIEMEIREIGRHLAAGDRVLDIGCANGYSTLRYATDTPVQIKGLDAVPEMIAEARARLQALPAELRACMEFAVGDATALPEASETYDKVVIVRVLINLGTWERQQVGLREACRVLKGGGGLLLSEATLQGWQKLNRFRREWGLPDIPVPPFNTYLDERRVIESVGGTMELIEIRNFASTYYVGTRVLKPLLDRALGNAINVADPEMEWNRWFSLLPAAGDYGTQKLFVLRKRA